MALIEDMFKGNLATGLAVGVGTVLLGPALIQTVGRTLRGIILEFSGTGIAAWITQA